MEEPPAKVTKFEMESQYLEGEVMDEGQEEWLSEDILTDDDYNPASQQTEQYQSDSNVASQDGTMLTTSADDSQSQPDNSINNADSTISSSNIEETLNNLENTQNNNQIADLPEELNAFLIRKTDGKVIGPEVLKKGSDLDESVKQSDDDGNDTDDLLRVLGDGDQASKQNKIEKMEINKDNGDSSDDDDNFIFEGRKVKNFNVAKSVLTRATATKAVPEDDDPTDCSTEEDETMRKIFNFKPNKSSTTITTTTTTTTPQISTTVKPGNFTISPLKSKEEPPKKVIKKVVYRIPPTIPGNNKTIEVKRPPVATRRTYINRRAKQGSSLLKTSLVEPKPQPADTTDKQEVPKDGNNKLNEMRRAPVSGAKQSGVTRGPDITDAGKLQEKSTESGKAPSDRVIIKEITKKVEEKKPPSQRLMRPEVMDEEIPTDPESDSDEESLYSEMPSSDSEIEDWFTLDIRTERAGDYLPLLGDRAADLLQEERRRVKSRLVTLKKSLAELSNSGRDLAEQLKDATNTVAELDALLKVT